MGVERIEDTTILYNACVCVMSCWGRYVERYCSGLCCYTVGNGECVLCAGVSSLQNSNTYPVNRQYELQVCTTD